LPSIEEQRRIAAILDAADDLRTKRRQALAKLDTLTQAIFIDMFGDPVANPHGFPESGTLSDIAEVTSGITKGRKSNGKPLEEVPYLAVVNVQDGEIVLDPLKTIEATRGEIERYSLEAGDIVLTEGGDPDKLGRGAVWQGQVDPCIHQNHIFRVRVHDHEFTPEYVSRLVGSERGKRYFLRMAKQTTGIASINMTQLRSFPILKPPIEAQHRYLAQISGLELNRAVLENSQEQLETLFASLQQRAFAGEL
jgi:type I restriction enzyme S subunit